MQIYRSSLLRFADDGQALYDEDGLLAVAPDDRGQQRVVAAGSWQALQAQFKIGRAAGRERGEAIVEISAAAES